METSIYIAKLLGPFFLVSGFSMVFNAKTIYALAQEAMESPVVVYLAGVLALIVGLALVNSHKYWAFGFVQLALGFFLTVQAYL